MYRTEQPGGKIDVDPLSLLEEFPVLSAITDAIWKQALTGSRVITCPAGTPLIQCGEKADKFVIILQGTVRVFEIAEDGREICLFRVFKGQVCALTLTRLLTQTNHTTQAIAEEEVQLLVCPAEYFERLMMQSVIFRDFVMSSMANCINEVMQLVRQVSFERLDLRLAGLLGKLSENRSSQRLSITHQEIADELGTTREVVSRLLKDFEHKGHVDLRRGSIELLSDTRLKTQSDVHAQSTDRQRSHSVTL